MSPLLMSRGQHRNRSTALLLRIHGSTQCLHAQVKDYIGKKIFLNTSYIYKKKSEQMRCLCGRWVRSQPLHNVQKWQVNMCLTTTL